MKKFLLPLFLIGCVLSGAITAEAQSNYEPYSFTTFAGIAPSVDTDTGTDGTGSAARFYNPTGVGADSAGNIYVADFIDHTIRKITPSGVVSTLAGLTRSSGSDDGIGCAARFHSPNGVAVDNAGNVYVADTFNSTIRKITLSGVVSTLAGLAGSSGSDDGIASAARFRNPRGVAVDRIGNVYVADSENSTIRKITPSGLVSTLAGLPGDTGSADGTGSAARFALPQGVAVDSGGNVYVADGGAVISGNHTIRKITPFGVVSTLAGQAGSMGSDDGIGTAARFRNPHGVTVDSADNVYVADTGNDAIRKITPSAVVSTLAGLAGGIGSADGIGSAARFHFPNGVAMDSAGNVYVADSFNNTIRKITPSAAVSTLAGLAASMGSADGIGNTARFDRPNAVVADGASNVYVADSFNSTIRKISPSGLVSTLAGLAGNIGSIDGTGSAARFNNPNGVAVDGAGNVYVADTFNSTIRKINPAGIVSTVAGLAGIVGSADGSASAARFYGPFGLAVDSASNVYVADTYNATIRKISPSGLVSTLAGLAGSIGSVDGIGSSARFNNPNGVAVDGAGNVYVCDTLNRTVRKITPSGVVSTLAGLAGSSGSDDGIGSAARFYLPFGVAVDNAGSVYVADGEDASSGNNTIRRITPLGVVSTLAGLAGSKGFFDGIGTAARFYFVSGVAVDSANTVYVADSANNTIRIGVPAPPLITTVAQPFVFKLEPTEATSFAVSNLPPDLTFDAQLSAIVGIPTATGTFQVVITATYPAITTNSTLTITVQPVPASGPIISSSTSATGRVGRPFSFQVLTTGGTAAARLSASGLPPGLSADPVTGIISGSAAAKGSSIATLIVTDGSFATTATLQLTFTADPALPVIFSPGFASLTPGEFFTYTISASATCGFSDGTIFTYIDTDGIVHQEPSCAGLPAGLCFDGIDTISGTYIGPLRASGKGGPREPELAGGAVLGSIQLFGTNSQGTGTLPLLFLPAPSGAVNVSTRLQVGTSQNVLIGGFIITGDAPKVVVIRAIGPSTGIPGALQDTTLELHDSANHVVYNDNWNDSQESLIDATAIPPTDFRESAIVIGLDPGPYTAIVAGKNGATGIGLVEVYDLGTDSLGSSGNSKLANISTRGFVDTGDNVLIGGFIIRHVVTRVIVRGIGPELNGNVSGALQDTTLELHDGSGSLIASNDDWRSTQEQEIIDTGVPPTDNRESAIVTTLNPGSYTAIVRGKDNTTGVGVVEVYDLGPSETGLRN
jgi:sugar lactone lactonase YvrE